VISKTVHLGNLLVLKKSCIFELKVNSRGANLHFYNVFPRIFLYLQVGLYFVQLFL
jgi:hypothetical protein